MAPRTLPGIGLQAFETPGTIGWNSWTDTNWRVVSAWLQGRVNSLLSVVPGSPSNGDRHILTGAPNANTMAVRDNGAWVYLTPQVGHRVYDEATALNYVFNGSAWAREDATAIKGVAAQKLSVFCVAGGTANAITLTYGQTPIATGMRVRFRATLANTGSTSINLDGGGTISCKTASGVNLPADYIRTDVDTDAYYNGTNWIVDRQVERASNANGEYTREADGTQTCLFAFAGMDATTAVGNVFHTTAEATWTFPIAFVNNTVSVNASARDATRWINARATSTSAANVRQYSATSSATSVTATLSAIGYWY